eukprot:1059372-Pelagomonas_calceolata.AAC.7
MFCAALSMLTSSSKCSMLRAFACFSIEGGHGGGSAVLCHQATVQLEHRGARSRAYDMHSMKFIAEPAQVQRMVSGGYCHNCCKGR